MARPLSESLTDRECSSWKSSGCKVLAPPRPFREACFPIQPHDSTVRTLLRILQKKGYVRIRGRQPAVYESTVDRSVVQSKATRSLLARFFEGSADALVLRLVEDEQLSAQRLDRLRKSLSLRKRKGGKSHDLHASR